ncbi:MAG: adenosylmethionine decarboxylase [Dehalococcoidia bacterium]
MHLIIDGYVTDPKKIQDPEFIYRFLDTYPDQIEMTKVSTPQVSEYTLEEQGVSAFVLLAESHISVHTFPDQSYVNIDVFSCREFDIEQAIYEVESQFGLSGARTYALERPKREIETG